MPEDTETPSDEFLTPPAHWVPKEYAQLPRTPFPEVWLGGTELYPEIQGELDERGYRERATLTFFLDALTGYEQRIEIDGVPYPQREAFPWLRSDVDDEIRERFGPGITRILAREDLDPDLRTTLEIYFEPVLDPR